jgi:guanine deaminase
MNMALSPAIATIYYGAVINPVSLTSYAALPHCLLAVDNSGNIEWIVDRVESHELQQTLAARGIIDAPIVTIPEGTFVIPGFIDTHTVSVIYAA